MSTVSLLRDIKRLLMLQLVTSGIPKRLIERAAKEKLAKPQEEGKARSSLLAHED